jgi:hypothetical protein
MRFYRILLLLLLIGCGVAQHRFTIGEIEREITSGSIPGFTREFLQDRLPIKVREIVVPLPHVQLFAFDDAMHTYTFLVDGSKVIHICGGPKGSEPHNFRLRRLPSSHWEFSFALDDQSDRGCHIFEHYPEK